MGVALVTLHWFTNPDGATVLAHPEDGLLAAVWLTGNGWRACAYLSMDDPNAWPVAFHQGKRAAMRWAEIAYAGPDVVHSER